MHPNKLFPFQHVHAAGMLQWLQDDTTAVQRMFKLAFAVPYVL